MRPPHLWSVSGGGDSGPPVPKERLQPGGHQQKGPRLERGSGPLLPACGQEDLHQPGSGSGPPWGMSSATQCPIGVARERRVAPAFWLR